MKESKSNGSNKQNWLFKATLILLLLISVFLSLVYTRVIILPKGVRHFLYLYHHIIRPEGFFDPIILGKFNFGEKGFSQDYKINPRYSNVYVIGLRVNDNIFSPKHRRFLGKFKLELYENDTLLDSKEITEIIGVRGSMNGTPGLDFYPAGVIYKLEIPVDGKYKNNVRLRLTVIESDSNYKKYQDSTTIFLQADSL